MKTIRITVLLLFGYMATYGQSMESKPEVGKRMKEFNFKGVKNYDKKEVSLEDFRGKWLFLDMWSATCKGCIASFPKIQKFQDAFPEQVQFFLVGWNTVYYNKGIEKIYENAVRNSNLRVPSAFDSISFSTWDVSSIPRIFVVDPNGMLRFITSGSDMSVEKIKDLLDGRVVSFLPMSSEIEHPEFDIVKTFGEDQLISCSVLTRWNREEIYSGYGIDLFVRFPELWKPGWRVLGAQLFELYNYAYLGKAFWMPYDSVFYGKIYARPILELRDTSDFLANYKVDNGKGIYNYSLKLPNSKVNRENIMGELQRSLDHAFGYKGIIERRSMPVWKLTARPGIAAKLRTHGGGQFISPGTTGAGFTVRNYDMSSFLVVASGGLPNTERLAFIDGTGIEGNIDITLDGDLLSLEGVRKALQKHGLDLMKDKKEMMVLVLKDPE